MDKKKTATKNPTNRKDNKCCQYAVTVKLNHDKWKSTKKIRNWELGRNTGKE